MSESIFFNCTLIRPFHRKSVNLYLRPLYLTVFGNGFKTRYIAVNIHGTLVQRSSSRQSPLYSPAERIRRDKSKWTLVQGVLAPIQFVVFLISAALVIRFLVSGEGLAIATGSVVLKTVLLYLIMVTGCIWEKEVYGVYLFAPAFFWEDVFSMLVLGLHAAYVLVLVTEATPARGQMWLALAAYAAYAINATQFILKLRRARLQSAADEARPIERGGRLTA